MTRIRILLAVAVALLLVFRASEGPAKNVDLSTVPDRDTVQLTIYNSADLTLARESRALTVKEGGNRLQFSWANTLIDPTSIEDYIAAGDIFQVVPSQRWAQPFPPPLQTAELIALRDQADPRWCLAVARWIRQDEQGFLVTDQCPNHRIVGRTGGRRG